MGRLSLRLIPIGHAPRCCAQPMDWDVFRASYVCWSCGGSR